MSPTPRRLAAAALTALALAGAPVPAARAQSGAGTQAADEATRLYGEGRKLVEKGKLAEALIALEASMKALPSPNTELLIGHVHRDAGRRPVAMETYHRVVATAGARLRAGEKRFQLTLEEAGRWIAVLRPELGEVVVLVRGAPPGTSIVVGGAPVEARDEGGTRSARAWRDPGEIAVTARAPDGREALRKASVAAGGSIHVDLALEPLSAPSAPPPETPADPAPPADEAPAPAWVPPVPSLIAGGIGVAGIGVFAIFGAMSTSAAADLDECAPSCPDSKRSDADAGKRDQTVANIGLVVGGVGLAGAVVLYFVLPRTEVRAALGPGRVGFSGRF